MTPQEYAFYRGDLEAGRALFTAWKEKGAVSLDAKVLLDKLTEVIPAAVMGVVIGLGELDDVDAPEPTAEAQALLATKAFGEYATLRAALDQAAGATYGELVQAAPAAATGDLEWWAVALSVGGLLAWVGKLAFKGAIVARIVGALFFALASYELLTAKTEEGKNVLAAFANDIKQAGAEAGKSVGRIIWWSLAGFSVLGLIGVGLYVYNRNEDEREKRRARRQALET